jgi:formyltetrahydrofolate deformylase
MKPTAILLLHCPDQQGIISEVTKFITDNKGNIVDLDQYVDLQDGMFFMRVQWELDSFLIPREKIKEYIETLYKQRYQIELVCISVISVLAWPFSFQR